jgi:hypothetical protein
MTIKQQVIEEIEEIDNPVALVQLFELIQMIKQNQATNRGNRVLLQFAGCIDDAEAQAMRKIIANEFNNIEGEW